MSNHPNRNWRARLQAGADQWLETDEARELAAASADPVVRRRRIRQAYITGFEAGRASNQRPARKPDSGNRN